ncbi:MAG: NAD-dependent epimerase/dehydratase family protein, partial [Actinomycetota bacterium]|nr:NAD-dependent epimerase/dehydratase family protein [Actinomycetota bacterium]
MLEGKKIFITGGAGFIATTLARRLVDANEIIAADNMHRDALSGTPLADHPNFTLHHADVLDLETMKELSRGATHVVH